MSQSASLAGSGWADAVEWSHDLWDDLSAFRERHQAFVDPVLEAMPIVGNVLSFNQLLEDLDQAVAAYERGDYRALAGYGGLGVLDALGVVPGVGSLLANPAKMAVLRGLRQIKFFRRLDAQRRLGKAMDDWPRPAKPEITTADLSHPKYMAEMNRRLSLMREDALAEILKDAGFETVIRNAYARTLGHPFKQRLYDARLGNVIERGPFRSARPGVPRAVHGELKGAHAAPSRGQKRFGKEVRDGKAVYRDDEGTGRSRRARWTEETSIPIRPEDEVFLRMLPDTIPLDRLRQRLHAVLRQAVAKEFISEQKSREIVRRLSRRNTSLRQQAVIGEGLASGYRGGYSVGRNGLANDEQGMPKAAQRRTDIGGILGW